MAEKTTRSTKGVQTAREGEEADERVDADLQEELVHHKYNEQQGVGLVEGITETQYGNLAVEVELPFGDETTTIDCGAWDSERFQAVLRHAGLESPEFDELVGCEVPLLHDEDEGWDLDEGELPVAIAEVERSVGRDEWAKGRDGSHIAMLLVAFFGGSFAGMLFSVGRPMFAAGAAALTGVVYLLFLVREYREIADLRDGRFDWIRT